MDRYTALEIPQHPAIGEILYSKVIALVHSVAFSRLAGDSANSASSTTSVSVAAAVGTSRAERAAGTDDMTPSLSNAPYRFQVQIDCAVTCRCVYRRTRDASRPSRPLLNSFASSNQRNRTNDDQHLECQKAEPQSFEQSSLTAAATRISPVDADVVVQVCCANRRTQLLRPIQLVSCGVI